MSLHCLLGFVSCRSSQVATKVLFELLRHLISAIIGKLITGVINFSAALVTADKMIRKASAVSRAVAVSYSMG